MMRAVIVPGQKAGWASIRVSGNVDGRDDAQFAFAIKRASTLSNWLGPVGWQAAETWFDKVAIRRLSDGDVEMPIGPEIVDRLEIGNYELFVRTSGGKIERTVVSCGRLTTSGASTGRRVPQDVERDNPLPSDSPIANEDEVNDRSFAQAPSPVTTDLAGTEAPEQGTVGRGSPLLWGALGVLGTGVAAAAIYLGGASTGGDFEKSRASAGDVSPAVSAPMSGPSALPKETSPHEQERSASPSAGGPLGPASASSAQEDANDQAVATIVGIQAARDYVGSNPAPQSAYVRGAKLLAEERKGEAYVLLNYAAERGVADAASALGRMYDPASIGVQSMFEPSKKMAIMWYKRAEELGDVDAAKRIQALQDER